MAETKERPAYVRFERKPLEDRAASLAAGQYRTKDVDMVIITPVGTKDEVEKVVADWLAQSKQQVQEGRLSPEFGEHYAKAYEAWKRGEEIPLDGTPIKTWPVISPAQRQNCIAANVRTVEDLATANGEALTRIGMGGQELRQKAETWLKASSSVGVVVQANAALNARVAGLEAQVKNLQDRNDALVKQLQAADIKVPA